MPDSLTGGRASGDPAKVEITGDTAIGTRIVENLNITP